MRTIGQLLDREVAIVIKKVDINRLNEGHEMKTIEETMSIIHLENNHRKINTLDEIKKY